MAKKNDRFELRKDSGKGYDLKKTSSRKFDLSKDSDDVAEVAAAATSEEKPVVTPDPTTVETPQVQVPAGVGYPQTSEKATDEAINMGPEQPKKKSTAWLWALIGIAVVLAFGAMIFLNRGNKEEEKGAEAVETAAPEDSATSEEEMALPAEEATEAAADNNSESGEQAATEAAPATTAENASNEAPATQATPAAPANSTSANATVPAPATASTAAPAAKATAVPTGDVEADAKKTIHGDYGDGDARKNALGSRYQEVQNRVNQLMRSGNY